MDSGGISSFRHSYPVGKRVGLWDLAGKQEEWHYNVYIFEKSLKVWNLDLRGSSQELWRLGGKCNRQMKNEGSLNSEKKWSDLRESQEQ